MGKWNELYSDLCAKHDNIKINPPANHEQISSVENILRNRLPTVLKEFLLEMNGDGWLIFSTEQIIKINMTVRGLDCFMPLNCLLFFAGNGCGDYYGFPITLADGVRDDNVFMWEHEYDNRVWKASNLEDTIRRYYNNEI